MTDSDRVGTASVDILGNLAPLREEIERGEALLKAFVEKEWKITIGAQVNAPARGSSGSSGTVKGAKASEAPVSANVEADAKTVVNSIQSALTNHNFKIFIDEQHLRTQIDNALKGAFNVTVNGSVSGGGEMPVSASPESPRAGGHGGAVPPEVNQALNQVKGLRDAVNALYATVNETRQAAGRSRIGSTSDDPGHEPRKLVHLMDEFGDNLKDWVTTSKVTTKSGSQRDQITGGRLFEHGRLLGLGDDGARALADLGKRVRTLSAASAFATNVKENREAIMGPSAPTGSASTIASAVSSAVGSVMREESRAAAAHATPVAPAARPEPATAAAPEKRLEPATALDNAKFDDLLATLKGRAASFATPTKGRGRAARGGTPGSQSAFDYDENLNRFISGAEIRDRTRGQLPTPSSPSGFNFAPYLRMASLGFFSNMAEEIGKNNKPNGRLIRFDPEEQNAEIQDRILKGRIGRIGESRAKLIRPADLFEKLLSQIVPKSDREETPEGSFLNRVSTKLVPGYASAFDRAPQAIKFGKENASGVVSQGGKRLDDLVRLDLAYIEAFEQLEMFERRVPGQSGASVRELEKRQQETRDRMSHLIDEGADPTSVAALNLSNSGRAAALRHRREVSRVTNRQSRENVAAGVGLSDFEKNQRRFARDEEEVAFQRSGPAQDRILSLGQGIREGRIPIPTADSEGKPLTTLRFFNQEVEKILDRLRDDIGDTSTSGTDVPRGFGPVSEAIRSAKELLVEPRPGGTAVPGGRFTRSISFPEQDRVNAEAAAHRATPGVDRLTTAGTEKSMLEGQLAKRQRDDDEHLSRLRAEVLDRTAKRQGGSVIGVSGVSGIDAYRFPTDAARARTEELVGRNARLKSAKSEAQDAQSAIRAQIDTLTRVSKAAERLVLRESGQRPIAQNIRQASAEEVRLGLAEPGQRLPGQFVRSSPTRTGAETADRIRGLKNIPDALRQEALELISSGQAPGLTSADVRRRAGLSQTEGLTGDKTREITGRTAFVAGESGRALTELERALSAAGGGSGGGNRRPGSDSYDEISGPVHVIVDNDVLRVSWGEGAPGSDGGGGGGRKPRGRVGGEGEPPEPPEGSGTGNGKPINPYQIKYIKDPKTGQIPESLRIQMRPKGVVSSEQRDAEAEAERLATIRKLPTGRVSPEQRAAEAEQERLRTIRKLPKAYVSPEQREAERALRGATRAAGAAGRAAGRGGAEVDENYDIRAKFRDEAEEELGPIRGKLRVASLRVPRRGFTSSVTDLITAKIGGGGFEKQIENLTRAQNEAQELKSLRYRQADLLGRREVLMNGLGAPGITPERAGQLNTKIAKVNEQLGHLVPAIGRSTAKFTESVEAASSFKATLRSFTAAGIGASFAAAAGSVTFGLGLAVTGPLIQGISEGVTQIIGPLVERASGFSQTTQRVTGDLAAGSLAEGGQTDIAFAKRAAQIGLAEPTAREISPLLTQRADVEAGNQQLQDQIDSFNAFLKVRDETKQSKGYEKNLTETTGGFSPLGFFGAPSTAQKIFDQLNGLPTATSRTKTEADITRNRGLIGDPNSAGGKYLQQRIDDLTKGLEEADLKLGFFNNALADGGEAAFKFSDNIVLSKEDKDAQVKAFKDARAGGLANLVAGGQLQLTENGKAVTSVDRIMAALRAIATPKATLPELLDAQKNQIQAQEGLRQQRLSLSLRTLLPSQLGLAEATSPLAPAKAGINTTGLSPSGVRSVNRELAQTQRLYDTINAEAEAGRKTAIDFVTNGADIFGTGQKTGGLGADAGEAFAAALGKAADYGKQISQIEIGIQTKQAAYQAAQFSYQIGIAKRNLMDAKGLVSGVGNSLGAIERQEYNLSRQSQQLGFGMSQRQINFQKAVAGFTAPGLTSEERDARIKEAKLEADYAQKQLDIQKQLFGLQGKGFEITASRAVADLVGQLSLLEQGRAITIDTAVAQKRITALTKLQEIENKKVEAYYAAAVEKTGDIMTLEASLVTATGDDLTKVAQSVLDAYAKVYNGLIREINTNNGTNPSGNIGATGAHARGIVGMTSGPTTAILGEAGNEAVAIIRNPRAMVSPLGGGGGGGTVYIVFKDAVVREESDLDRLAARVEQKMNEHGQLLGIRPFGG